MRNSFEKFIIKSSKTPKQGIFFSLALLAKISPIKLDLSIFFTFLAFTSFSIDEAETKVFFCLSSIICANRFFKDFVTEILYLFVFTSFSFTMLLICIYAKRLKAYLVGMIMND